MKKVGQIQYETIRQIGVGQGMNSKVYLANELQLGGVVAVKEIPKANLGTSFNEYFDEARAMFNSQHLHVVPVSFACELVDRISLVMPYFRNGSLTDRIQSHPVSLKEGIRIALGLLSGLERIHSAGHIHFDVKPSNVLFSDNDVPMVADFGQSRQIGSGGTVDCPPMYPTALPPEFYRSGIGTVHSDIYQAGLTLYRALNGDQLYASQIPANAADMQPMVIAGKFPNRDNFLPHIPNSLRRVIRKAIRTDAADRYQSAPEFADALARVEIDLNWEIESMSSGEIEFRAQRDKKPIYVVKLVPDGSRWKYEVFTLQGTTLRAKAKTQWKDSLTYKQAFTSLKELFSVLG